MVMRLKIAVTGLLVGCFAALCHGQLISPTDGGTNSRISASIGMGAAEMTPIQYAALDRAVKNVVGPHASPDLALIAYAAKQGAPPRTVFQIFGYVPFLQNIARRVGLRPVPSDMRNHNGAKNINDLVMQRAVKWVQTNGLMMVAGR